MSDSLRPRGIAARQVSLSVGFSRQESWSGLPCPPLGDLPDPVIKPGSLKSPQLRGRFFITSASWDAHSTSLLIILYIYIYIYIYSEGQASLMAQLVKNPPAMRDTRVRSWSQEDPLEEEMATHSNILAWRIPRTEEPGGLQSMGSQRAGHS